MRRHQYHLTLNVIRNTPRTRESDIALLIDSISYSFTMWKKLGDVLCHKGKKKRCRQIIDKGM